jgi:signal transduction histidine kinase
LILHLCCVKLINQFIIGKQAIQSEEHRKRILLAGYFILIHLATGSFWLILSFFDRFSNNTATLLGFIVNIICLYLIRRGWFYIGTFILLLRVNGVTAYYAWLYPDTSSEFFFFTCGLAALAIFGYEKRWIGITYSLVSVLLYLFLTTQASDFILGSPHFHHQISFAMTYISLALLIYFFNYLTYQYNQIAIRQNETLIKTNQELDRFVYTASHDLKAPLNSVIGLLNVVKLVDDPKEIKSLLEMVERSINSLKKFIGEVTDYSRNSRTEVAYETIELLSLIEGIRANLEFDERAKRISWHINIPKEFTFRSDPYRMHIVLNNLLSNAIKYSDLSKSDPQIKITATQAPNKVILTVADNGIGIEKDKIPELFKMFYRATNKETGSGLGLYIAKESIEKLNGNIELQSSYGKGSTFTITLPLVVSTKP